jgi:hypothetical protein
VTDEEDEAAFSDLEVDRVEGTSAVRINEGDAA